MRWVIVVLLLSCSLEVEPDPCESWTWIDEESCFGDVCVDQHADDYECREGACWCCFEGVCRNGSR